jgi:hypothetical protein
VSTAQAAKRELDGRIAATRELAFLLITGSKQAHDSTC